MMVHCKRYTNRSNCVLKFFIRTKTWQFYLWGLKTKFSIFIRIKNLF